MQVPQLKVKMNYDEPMIIGVLPETYNSESCHRLECWRVPHTTGQHLVPQPT